MENNVDNVDTLHNLGLTSTQAKVFVHLIRHGKQKIQTISENIDIDRANTYQAIAQLQKIGLVQKLLGSTVFYEAVALEEGISTLLKQKENKFSDIKKQAEQLLKSIQPSNVNEKDDTQIKIYIARKEKIKKGVYELISSARESFDLLLNKRTFYLYVLDLSRVQLTGMRHLKYRILTEKINLNHRQTITLQRFLKMPECQIRFLHDPLVAELVIMDKKEASVPLYTDNAGRTLSYL